LEVLGGAPSCLPLVPYYQCCMCAFMHDRLCVTDERRLLSCWRGVALPGFQTFMCSTPAHPLSMLHTLLAQYVGMMRSQTWTVLHLCFLWLGQNVDVMGVDIWMRALASTLTKCAALVCFCLFLSTVCFLIDAGKGIHTDYLSCIERAIMLVSKSMQTKASKPTTCPPPLWALGRLTSMAQGNSITTSAEKPLTVLKVSLHPYFSELPLSIKRLKSISGPHAA
jgi:hypothetical protein